MKPECIAPAPLKLDAKTVALWELLRHAVEAEEDWLALQVDLDRLEARLDGMARRRKPTLIFAFNSLKPRLAEVTNTWKDKREVIKLNIQHVAWEFTAHAFELRYENHVDFTEWQPQTMSADRLLYASSKLGDLALEGRSVQEDGSSSGEKCWISLLRTPWSKSVPAP